MKMKKILFSVFMIAAMALMAVVGFSGTNKVEAGAGAHDSQAQAIFKTYWNNGVYTKQTVINVTKEVQDEGKKVFHAGANALERTTYYNGSELWMTNAEGTINSGYGTSDKGMTHFSKDKTTGVNNTPDYTVKGTTMEDYYVTLDDLKTSIGWLGVSGIYTSEDEDTLDAFRQFVAPMWLSGEETENYVNFEKATMQETEKGLVLKLYVSADDSGKVTTKDLVFAEALVTRGLYSLVCGNTRIYLDQDGDTLTTKDSVFAGTTYELSYYHHTSKTISSYSGNFVNSIIKHTNNNSTITVTLGNTISMNATTGQYVYLKPNTNWKEASARFAARFWDDSDNDIWADMSDSNSDGTYEVELPDVKYTNVIFCRMNPSTTENNWDNKWDQTNDLTVNLGKTYTIKENYWKLGSWNNEDMKTNKLYLKPNSNWLQDGARFAAYFFGAGDTWVSMTYVSENVYEVTIPTGGYTSVIFVRMDPSKTSNDWNSTWGSQTPDLGNIKNNHGKLYTVKDGTWNKGGGNWSDLFN